MKCIRACIKITRVIYNRGRVSTLFTVNVSRTVIICCDQLFQSRYEISRSFYLFCTMNQMKETQSKKKKKRGEVSLHSYWCCLGRFQASILVIFPMKNKL